jgi:hypothetical protein
MTRARVDLLLDSWAELYDRVIFLELACRDLMLEMHAENDAKICLRCSEFWPCRALRGYEP